MRDVQEVLSHKQFETIRSALKFRPNNRDTPDVEHQDPLWFSRTVVKKLMKNCVSVAVTDGVHSFDEVSIRERKPGLASKHMFRASLTSMP